MRRKRQAKPRKLKLVPKRNQPLVNIFLQALAAMYPKDKLTAGVTLAWLPQEKKFYGSVCRYPEGCFARPPYKEVIVAVKEDSPQEVLEQLAQGWHSKTQPLLEFNQRMQKQMRRVK